MLCPHCGKENEDDALLCAECGYRFQFGHAYNDPAKMSLLEIPKSTRKPARIFAFALLSVLLFILGFIIWSTLNAK